MLVLHGLAGSTLESILAQLPAIRTPTPALAPRAPTPTVESRLSRLTVRAPTPIPPSIIPSPGHGGAFGSPIALPPSRP
jgi:hypothetical protein